MDIHNLLSKVYENDGNKEESYKHFKLFSKIKDSINQIQNVRSLTYYQTLYETKKRDATIQNQESEISLLDAQNKIKQQWMLFGGIGLFVLFLFIYLRIKEKHRVEALENKLLSTEIEYKKKDLKHLALDINHNKEMGIRIVRKNR